MRLRKSLLFFCLFAGFVMQAQFYDDDARLWLYLKLNKKINERLKLQAVIQNRFENNISGYTQLNGNLELKYKLYKRFRLQAGYVFGGKQRPEGTYNRRHQVYAGITYSKSFGQIKLTYRNLVQVQTKNIYSSKKGKVPGIFDRNKLTLTYELNKRFDVYLSDEINLPIHTTEFLYISRNRTFAGMIFHLSKKAYVESYFLLQRKYAFEGQPERAFIYGFTYSYSF